jgi:hypothetical protein
MIDKVELLVGGQVIDDQDAFFTNNIAPNLFATGLAKSVAGELYDGSTAAKFYPLRFSFCENWQSALPLVALQYHDVELRIRWKSHANVDSSVRRVECHANYIYLDTDERELLARDPRAILITQVQKSLASLGRTQELNFNHPVKFLAASNVAADSVNTAANRVKLQINGTDVTDFKFIDPHYTSATSYYHSPNAKADPSLYTFPFCLDTSKLQPTGSLLGRSLDVPRVSRYDVDTETPRPEKLVVDYDTTVNSSPTDISGQGNHGTFRDSSGAPSYSPADKAFNFSGVNGVIVSGALSPAMTGDRICSMSCWFKTTDAANNNTQTLMWLGAYSGQGFIGLLIQNNQLKLTIGSERAIKTTSSPIQSNQWYHVVAIKSGTGQINSSTANGYFQIYINGEKSTDTTFQNQTGTLNITTNYLYLGAGGVSGQEPLNGYISNPKLYNVALEPSEVKKLYNLGRTGRSMVISDTAVGIGKVPEANLDVRGSLAVRGSLVLPTLTTFDSITGLTGMIRFNTAMATLQVHNGSTWVTINGVSATGGTISNADGYVIHTFTNVSDTFTMLSSGNIEYLVVAGGGGGGTGGATAHEAGGGGAGGLLSGTISNLPPGSYTVTVGGGGAAMSNGTNSSINFPTTITAIGGGKGDGGASGGGNGGGNGGSGGGGRYNTAGGNGTSGQGNDGSGGAYYMGTSGTYSNSGGGGGGAGQAGGQGGVTDGGNGVQFTYYNHKGSPAGWFAGGGRGAVVSSGTHPSWTAYGGGGSPNSVNNSGNTTAGVANTGGGGGGSWSSTSSVVGGAGGSGIVIIRYLS